LAVEALTSSVSKVFVVASTWSEGMAMRLAWGLAAIVFILWLVGLGLHIAGSLIHLLLVVAFVILIIDLLSGRRSAA
jgi:Family of unknown function (DUF5670)